MAADEQAVGQTANEQEIQSGAVRPTADGKGIEIELEGFPGSDSFGDMLKDLLGQAVLERSEKEKEKAEFAAEFPQHSILAEKAAQVLWAERFLAWLQENGYFLLANAVVGHLETETVGPRLIAQYAGVDYDAVMAEKVELLRVINEDLMAHDAAGCSAPGGCSRSAAARESIESLQAGISGRDSSLLA